MCDYARMYNKSAWVDGTIMPAVYVYAYLNLLRRTQTFINHRPMRKQSSTVSHANTDSMKNYYKNMIYIIG